MSALNSAITKLMTDLKLYVFSSAVRVNLVKTTLMP